MDAAEIRNDVTGLEGGWGVTDNTRLIAWKGEMISGNLRENVMSGFL